MIADEIIQFANIVPYECTSMGLVVIEASMWLLYGVEGDFIV